MAQKTLVEGMKIPFDITKELIYKKNLGSGGNGETHLFYDEIMDVYFAVKKYNPIEENDVEENYKRFIDEIKILFNIVHPNIVRIYNYSLYPIHKIGYLQMEYIDGLTIDKFIPSSIFGWDEVFIQLVDAFCYLEHIGILHRDIRPANFMISNNNQLKIIDFGFGKIISKENNINSVYLNWPVTIFPEELQREFKYDFKTEIYFLGKMMEKLIDNNAQFSYKHIIKKMISYDLINRYQTFEEIKGEINSNLFTRIHFSFEEKDNYQKFANKLITHISKFTCVPKFVLNSNEIIENIATLINNHALEETIIGNNNLINCFVSKDTSYIYNSKCDIELIVVVNFYKMLISLNENKRTIIISNIINRLKQVKIDLGDDELPF